MWLGRQHIYFISDYAAAFPNVKVLLLFKNTNEQFSSTIENFHIKPKLPFPYASIFLYFIIISVSCCQYKKDRHNIYTEHIFLFQSTDAVPVLFFVRTRMCSTFYTQYKPPLQKQDYSQISRSFKSAPLSSDAYFI